MAEEAELRLPPAPPGLYLRWMRYWREIERVMVDYPRLAELAGEESAPFLRDPIAEYLSHEVIPQIVEQAEGAATAPKVSPVLVADVSKIRRALDYIAKRAGWLSQPGVHDALGVAEPDSEIRDLRARVVVAVAEQLRNLQADRR